MAGVPSKDDKLTAKVLMYFYMDDKCTVPFPPVPPGIGYKRSWQVADRKAGEEVGLFTGISSDVAYQVNWVQKYRVTANTRNPYDRIIARTSFVRKSEVTGFWDKGVDSPLTNPNNVVNQPIVVDTTDNTNLYLGLALAGTAFVKFILPKIQNK